MTPHLPKYIFMYFFKNNSAHSTKVIDSDLIHVDSKRLIKGKKHC